MISSVRGNLPHTNMQDYVEQSYFHYIVKNPENFSLFLKKPFPLHHCLGLVSTQGLDQCNYPFCSPQTFCLSTQFSKSSLKNSVPLKPQKLLCPWEMFCDISDETKFFNMGWIQRLYSRSQEARLLRKVISTILLTLGSKTKEVVPTSAAYLCVPQKHGAWMANTLLNYQRTSISLFKT